MRYNKFGESNFIEKIDGDFFDDPIYRVIEIIGGFYKMIEQVFELDENGDEVCKDYKNSEPIWKHIEEVDEYYKDYYGSPIKYKFDLLTSELTEL